MLRGNNGTPDIESFLQTYSLMGSQMQSSKQEELNVAAEFFDDSAVLGHELDEWIGTPFSNSTESLRKQDAFNAPVMAAQVPFNFANSPNSDGGGGGPSWHGSAAVQDPLAMSSGKMLTNLNNNCSPSHRSIMAATDGTCIGDTGNTNNVVMSPANSGGHSGSYEGTHYHQNGMKIRNGLKAESGCGQNPDSLRPAKLANRSHLTQRRYRERQKAKTADLEIKVQELREENRALLQERTDLLGRNSVLLQLLEQRDKQIADVQAKANLEPLRSSSLPPSPMDERQEDGNDLAENFSGSLTLTVQEEMPIELTPEQVKLLSQQELARLWREYVNKLALLLVATENRPSQTHLVKRIEQLTKEAGLLITRVTVRNPLGVKNFVAQKLEDDKSVLSREESSEVWLHNAARLGLSGEQKESIRRLRTAYVEKLEQMLQDRKEALHALGAFLPSFLSTRITAANFVKSSEIVNRLRRSMEEETAMVVDFIGTLYEQIFNHMQRARYIVGSYPWTPDHLAFATAVAAELGDASAREVLSHPVPSRSHSDRENSC